MFYGCELTFDGKSCTAFDLMLYDFASNKQEDVSLASPGELITDHVPGRYDTYLYGIDQSQQLEYKLILCSNAARVNQGRFFSRSEIANIAKWLCGHQTWKWLSIQQDDMLQYQYKCLITSMRVLTHGAVPWGFEFTVRCDSPYAYQATTWDSEIDEVLTGAGINKTSFTITREDSYHGDLYPVIEVTLLSEGSSTFSIVNHSDSDRACTFTGLPSYITKMRIDGDKQTITVFTGEDGTAAVIDEETGEIIEPATDPTWTEISTNVFPYFNKQFFRLVDGVNTCTFTGPIGHLVFSYYAPYDIGA